MINVQGMAKFLELNRTESYKIAALLVMNGCSYVT